MSSMHGAVRSNWFKVHDFDAFKAWFEKNVKFGDSIEIWFQDGLVAFGGYEEYPSAFPQMPDRWDTVDGDEVFFEGEPWDLEAFAVEVRKHLCEGQELHVMAAGHEKLRFVAADRIAITHETSTSESWYAGNG